MKAYENQVVFTNKAKCLDCYRCVRACPVKAIKMDNGQASVEGMLCISCGTCIKECPQGAKTFRNDLENVKAFIRESQKVAVSLAPSFAGIFEDWECEMIPSALRSLGFSYVGETAIGAYYSALETAKAAFDVMGCSSIIASACPALVNYIEKYDPSSARYLAPVASPMVAHAKEIKQKMGEDCKVVFIGPCIAKKDEADRSENKGIIDAVLTFKELKEWFEEEEIDLSEYEASDFDERPAGDSRLYPLVGGFMRTADIPADMLSIDVVGVSGFDEISEAMKMIKNSGRSVILEPLFCKLGCVNGPGVESEKSVFERRAGVLEFAKKSSTAPVAEAYELQLSVKYTDERALNLPRFSEDEILHILEKIGKANPEDRLNCGSCGYPNCREKAIAVLSGKAHIEMCVPYMRRVAELKKEKIIETSPNGIVILDEYLNIIHTNTAFRKFFMCSQSVMGKPISYLMDPEFFVKLATGEEDQIEVTIRHENYSIVCHEIIYKLKEEKQIVGIFVNVTNNLSDKNKLDTMKQHTLLQAQELLNHQISMAQSIAKLLGESTAHGEQLLENLMKVTQDEQKQLSRGSRDWLWDMYTSK